MIIDIYNTKESFLKIKPSKTFIILIIIILISIIFLSLTLRIQIYDNYSTKGLVTCEEECLIKTYLPSTITPELLKLNNNYVAYNILKNEVITDEAKFETYQALEIKVESKLKDQEIVNLNFYYNKQRIIIKIKNKIF